VDTREMNPIQSQERENAIGGNYDPPPKIKGMEMDVIPLCFLYKQLIICLMNKIFPKHKMLCLVIM